MSASVPDRALVSDQAATRLDPSGFDPSRLQWRAQTSQYASGKDLRLSGILIGSVVYDGVSSQTVLHRYVIATRLPGLRPKIVRFPDESSAMAALERFTAAWFARVLPSDSDGSGEAGETRSGSTEGDSAGPKGIAQTPASRNPNP